MNSRKERRERKGEEAMKLGMNILLALLLAQAGRLAAEEKGAEPAIPLTEPPQKLRDASGEPETDLIDPFQRRTGRDAEDDTASGLLRTSFGEISEEFRILSIIVPQDTNTLPMALIKLHNRAEPHLIRPGDLVRIDRGTVMNTARGGKRPAVPAASTLAGVLSALERYTFYLYVKEIQPTYIEVYHNKKSPDETIILSW
jgi:hypothetical protein